MDFDRSEWIELLQLADVDPLTRLLLFQYSQQFNREGYAAPQFKVLSKATGVSEGEVRKMLLKAKDAQWLEPVLVNGRKGYRATIPAEM